MKTLNEQDFIYYDFLDASDYEAINILRELCPDFASYGFLKKLDLYKGSLFGGTNVYYKFGKDNQKGLITTKTNIRLYGLEKFPYNFCSERDRIGKLEYGWSGAVLMDLLRHLQACGASCTSEQSSGYSKKYEKSFSQTGASELWHECDEHDELYEGHATTIHVNKYERNPVARHKCLAYHGCRCAICNIDFGERYGSFATGFIHVHHLKPLHTIGTSYSVDPINDLIPVCPNCHAMIHKIDANGSVSLENLKVILNQENSILPSQTSHE